MGASIKLPSATFSKSKLITALTLPVRTGLVSEFVLGGSQASSIKNLADSSFPLTVTGVPEYFDNSVLVKYSGYGNHYFTESKNVPLVDMTLISIRKKAVVGASGVATTGNYTGFLDYTPLDFYNSQSGTAANVANLPNPTHSNFFFEAATGPYYGIAKVFLYTDGVLSTALQESLGGARPALPFVIGSSYGGGIGEHAFMAVYDRLLSDAEIAQAYAAMKAYYAARGVTVS
jgi:hypothetical protein